MLNRWKRAVSRRPAYAIRLEGAPPEAFQTIRAEKIGARPVGPGWFWAFHSMRRAAIVRARTPLPAPSLQTLYLPHYDDNWMRSASTPSLREARTSPRLDVAWLSVRTAAESAILKQEGRGNASRKRSRTPWNNGTAQLGTLGMDIYCETCVQLWAEYGAATARMSTAATPTWEAAQARIEAACEAVRMHGAEAHGAGSAD